MPTKSEPAPSLQQLTYQTAQQGGACEVEPVTYQLRGELVRNTGSTNKSSVPSARSSSIPGTLLVTVAESTSVVSCEEDIVRVASPGAELSTTAYPADADRFALDLPSAIIGGQRPAIWVRALVDSNENGECDEGELVGAVELEESELGDLAILLSDDGCPSRL